MKKLILIVGLMVMLVISMGWGFSKAYADITFPTMVSIGYAGYGGVDYNYEIGKYEVTYGQYTDFEANPDQNHVGDNYPVEEVSWFDAARYCNWLTENHPDLGASEKVYTESGDWDADLTNLGYRLPTEDEYYKAAAWTSGTTYTKYGFGRGDPIDGRDANYNSGDGYDFGETTTVGYYDGINLTADGSTATNADTNQYGLYDMSGNVGEWNNEWSEPFPDQRVFRGGHWNNPDYTVTAIHLGNRLPSDPAPTIGLRVARLPEPSTLLLFFPGLFGLLPFLKRRKKK